MNDVNLLSLILATATPAVIGSLFYHPRIFGSALNSAVVDAAKKRNPILVYGLFLLVSFLLSFFLLNFNNIGINQEGEFDNFLHGAWHGMFVAITTILPVVVINGLLEQRSAKHILIHILYWLITVVLMGGMLDAMNHWENIPMPEGMLMD